MIKPKTIGIYRHFLEMCRILLLTVVCIECVNAGHASAQVEIDKNTFLTKGLAAWASHGEKYRNRSFSFKINIVTSGDSERYLRDCCVKRLNGWSLYEEADSRLQHHRLVATNDLYSFSISKRPNGLFVQKALQKAWPKDRKAEVKKYLTVAKEQRGAEAPSVTILSDTATTTNVADLGFLFLFIGIPLPDIPWDDSSIIQITEVRQGFSNEHGIVAEVSFKRVQEKQDDPYLINNPIISTSGVFLNESFMLKSGTLSLAVEKNWLPIRAECIFDHPTEPFIERSEWKIDENEFLPIREVTHKIYLFDKPDDLLTTFLFHSIQEEPPPTSAEFKLSHYGLPEPNLSRSTWKFWWWTLFGISLLGLILALRFFNRPKPGSSKTHRRKNVKPAFTLIELLVVIAIIGVLVGITLPAVQMVREAARRTQCTNHLKQIGIALQNYESAYRKLPPGVKPYGAPQSSMSWLVPILPFVEQQAIWDQALEDYRIDPEPFRSHLGMRTIVPVYQCPSDPASDKIHWTHHGYLVATTSYLGVSGTNYTKRDGVFYVNSQTRFRDISDGLSNTLMVGERPPSPDYWYGWWYAGYGSEEIGALDMLLGVRELKPTELGGMSYLESCPPGPYHFVKARPGDMCGTLHFWSYHPGGGNFLLCDGSVRFMPYTADELLPALATRAGQEVATLPE